MTIESATIKGTLTFQGVTENSSDTDTCIDLCKTIGTINADYTMITLIQDSGGKIVL